MLVIKTGRTLSCSARVTIAFLPSHHDQIRLRVEHYRFPSQSTLSTVVVSRTLSLSHSVINVPVADKRTDELEKRQHYKRRSLPVPVRGQCHISDAAYPRC